MTQKTNKGRILAVDDASETLELIQRILSANGYQVFTAPGANEAIRILEGTVVDLVVTDYKMPKVNDINLV